MAINTKAKNISNLEIPVTENKSVDVYSIQLEEQYKNLLITEPTLNRRLVSFQKNKSRSVYRWYKFKEAFSAELVEHLLSLYGVHSGTLFDPFAGSGTALFASAEYGLHAEGIELLPIGQTIIDTKKIIDTGLTQKELATLKLWANEKPWNKAQSKKEIQELRITKGAYPDETQSSIEKYLYCLAQEPSKTKAILKFALLCVLEKISYTRKDGQYLRWDYRANRTRSSGKFNKGHIPPFDAAIVNKIEEIITDISNTPLSIKSVKGLSKEVEIKLYRGSCLNVLPTTQDTMFDCIVTSPPYCNRYDYTRTYALELALLGVNELELTRLRQEMLSCTVENREKNLLKINPNWHKAILAADRQKLLQVILDSLDQQRELKYLNNNGIPRMVRGYFYEMACVIQECARILKPGAPMIMVNDNVRYAGISIPVDLILSDIAKELGFIVEKIMVLPTGKGNSSQQMGAHGRKILRKCVYVWRKK